MSEDYNDAVWEAADAASQALRDLRALGHADDVEGYDDEVATNVFWRADSALLMIEALTSDLQLPRKWWKPA